MKRWGLRLVLLGAVVAMGDWGWKIMFPSPERVIRRRLVEVAQLASFGSNEGALAKIGNATKLSTYFDPDVQIRVEVPGRSHRHTFSGRDELLQAAMAARSQLTSLSLQFLDMNVSLAPDQASATVNLTAKGNIGGEKDVYVQELRVGLKRLDRTWLITWVEPVKTLL